MLLVVNIGNSRIAYGLCEEGKLQRSGRVARTDLERLPDELGPARVERIVACSVVPAMDDRVASLLAMRYGLPVDFAGRDLPYSIEIECDEPKKVGADRVVNAIAAWARRRGRVIVVDAGTAITADLVSDRGAFCGGAIAPGPETMATALHAHTALLPRTPPAKPASPLGRNTAAAIQSGVYWGAVGMIRELVARLREISAPDTPVILTGGAGELLAADLDRGFVLVPDLTLEGLAILAAH